MDRDLRPQLRHDDVCNVREQRMHDSFEWESQSIPHSPFPESSPDRDRPMGDVFDSMSKKTPPNRRWRVRRTISSARSVQDKVEKIVVSA